MDQDATTLCQLVRIETKDGTVFGFTDLDTDVIYDDGSGPVTYQAENGFTPSRYEASADTSIDNAELTGIVSDTGITAQEIRAGIFDYARVRVYRINYEATSNGHEIMAVGTLGETRFSESGFTVEFRSLMQQLKQPVSVPYSTDCRARFGSKLIGTATVDSNGDLDFEEQHPCGKDFTWFLGAIDSLGSNTKRIFVDAGLSQTGDFFVPGVVEILSGPNVGLQMEVDDYDGSTKTVTLALALPYALTAGVTYRIRQDCSKQWDDANHGCLYHYGSDRVNHFQGEPHIPVADGGSNLVPGAQIAR